MKSHTYEIRVAAVGLFVHDQHVLLLHQALGIEANCWDLPGGGIDPGEPILDGLRREVQEETGISEFEVVRLLTVVEQIYPKFRSVNVYLQAFNIVYLCAVSNRDQVLESSDPGEVGPWGIQWLALSGLTRSLCSLRCWKALEAAELI